MSTSKLLDKIKLDRYYQVGTILSFIILTYSISFEVKVLNNIILFLFSLSFLFFFFGVWTSTTKSFERHPEGILSYTHLKKTKFGTGAFSISFILFILGLINLYKFLS